MDRLFEEKLDKALAYLQGVKDIPTLMQIMNILGLEPGGMLDVTDRRKIVRAMTRYLNDENTPLTCDNFDAKLDHINNI